MNTNLFQIILKQHGIEFTTKEGRLIAYEEVLHVGATSTVPVPTDVTEFSQSQLLSWLGYE